MVIGLVWRSYDKCFIAVVFHVIRSLSRADAWYDDDDEKLS